MDLIDRLVLSRLKRPSLYRSKISRFLFVGGDALSLDPFAGNAQHFSSMLQHICAPPFRTYKPSEGPGFFSACSYLGIHSRSPFLVAESAKGALIVSATRFWAWSLSTGYADNSIELDTEIHNQDEVVDDRSKLLIVDERWEHQTKSGDRDFRFRHNRCSKVGRRFWILLSLRGEAIFGVEYPSDESRSSAMTAMGSLGIGGGRVPDAIPSLSATREVAALVKASLRAQRQQGSLPRVTPGPVEPPAMDAVEAGTASRPCALLSIAKAQGMDSINGLGSQKISQILGLNQEERQAIEVAFTSAKRADFLIVDGGYLKIILEVLENNTVVLPSDIVRPNPIAVRTIVNKIDRLSGD